MIRAVGLIHCSVQLRKTQIPKTLFDKISDFSWNTGYLSVWQVLGHYYYSTGDVASFQGFFLKQKRVERDETYHKCGARTQLGLTKHWI